MIDSLNEFGENGPESAKLTEAEITYCTYLFQQEITIKKLFDSDPNYALDPTIAILKREPAPAYDTKYTRIQKEEFRINILALFIEQYEKLSAATKNMLDNYLSTLFPQTTDARSRRERMQALFQKMISQNSSPEAKALINIAREEVSKKVDREIAALQQGLNNPNIALENYIKSEKSKIESEAHQTIQEKLFDFCLMEYDSLTTDNKKRMEKLLGERYESYNKLSNKKKHIFRKQKKTELEKKYSSES